MQANRRSQLTSRVAHVSKYNYLTQALVVKIQILLWGTDKCSKFKYFFVIIQKERNKREPKFDFSFSFPFFLFLFFIFSTVIRNSVCAECEHCGVIYKKRILAEQAQFKLKSWDTSQMAEGLFSKTGHYLISYDFEKQEEEYEFFSFLFFFFVLEEN